MKKKLGMILPVIALLLSMVLVASPVAAQLAGTPMLFVASYDGRVYAFGPPSVARPTR